MAEDGIELATSEHPPVEEKKQTFDDPVINTHEDGVVNFDSNGLSITVETVNDNLSSEDFDFSGNILIPKGTSVGTLDYFLPLGTHRYVEGTRTLVIAKAIRGLNDFFKAIDEGKIPTPKILLGTTNPRMAEFSKRLGFRVLQDVKDGEPKENDSSAGKPEFKDIQGLEETDEVDIIGETEIIRARLNEYNSKYPINSKLFERATKGNS